MTGLILQFAVSIISSVALEHVWLRLEFLVSLELAHSLVAFLAWTRTTRVLFGEARDVLSGLRIQFKCLIRMGRPAIRLLY